MPKQTAKSAAAAVAAKKASSSKTGTAPAKKTYHFPMTTKQDVEQGTYTAERAEDLRAGNMSAVA